MFEKVFIPQSWHLATECCPNCGSEIDLIIKDGTEKIPFCPYCGEKNVILCSDCMDRIEDCDPGNLRSYCHGCPNGNK